MIVTLAFRENSGDLTDTALAWWTNCKYTHVEIIIKDKWISSNPSTGVIINRLRPLKESWDYIDVDIDGRRIPTALLFAQEQEGKDYDWNGIFFSQFFNVTRGENQDKWFCSELVSAILVKLGSDEINLEPAQYNPSDLRRIFSKVFEKDC